MAKERICAACGTVGKAKTITRGSIWIEIILWLFFLVPGLIYSIWRHTTRVQGCGACGGTQLLPLDSPGGRAALARFSPST